MLSLEDLKVNEDSLSNQQGLPSSPTDFTKPRNLHLVERDKILEESKN